MADAELDLIWMSLVIFVPAFFALALLFFPRGTEEYMRWWSLLGTAVTLVLSLCVFIDYTGMQGQTPDKDNRPNANTSLLARHDAAADAQFTTDPLKVNVRKGGDWLSRVPWISRFNIDYYLGIDGISMPLILLTTLLSFLAMIASWNIEKHVRGYCALFLLLETGMIGTFFALDFFLFYIFWEVMLLPMYFLIGVWGGPRREYAAIKFFLYTLLGSVFILIALLAFYFTDVRDFVDQQKVERAAEQRYHDDKPNSKVPFTGLTAQERESYRAKVVVNSFDLITLAKAGKAAMLALTDGRQEDALSDSVNPGMKAARAEPDPATRALREAAVKKRLADQDFFSKKGFQITMFLLLFIGFAIKVPLFPFHTWLPDAHVEAPTPISMILAGVLLKFGGYGIIRICYPICPFAAEYLAVAITIVAMINIVYGAFAAMAQTDFKKLVAYSSISHMGYVILGIAVWSKDGPGYWSWAMNGAMFQMIAHGITSAGMFFLVGVIYDRAHHRNLDNFRGLNEPMPLYGGISAIIFFAAMGLPGMCGFVGEFMVILGTWNFSPAQFPALGQVLAVLSALTVILTAAYILWTLQRVCFGTNPAYKDFPDINLRELLCIVPLVILAIALGVLPGMFLLNWMEPHVTGLVDSLAQLGR
ncbi:MAG TPA: NADH-quinone oxidoreductase subunit M [Gemmataceae bacterium]|nr:NADH-quinone oxidoreductase subunit M [Gemmataceae bacterium]